MAPIALSTIVTPKGSPTTSPASPSKQIQITPTAPCWALIDDGTGTLTQDHRTAHLQAGIAHKFNSGPADSRIVLLADAAQNIDYQEAPIPVGAPKT